MMNDTNVLIGLIDYKPLVVLDESILKGSTRMNKSNLLAPEKYNIVSEIENMLQKIIKSHYLQG